MTKSYNIVFMGTPDFAVPPLKALHKSPHRILQVVTQPDRPKGRGRKLIPPPVKVEAQKLGYDLVQPESVKTDRFIKGMKALSPDLFVVVAFGHLLPQKLLDVPKIGPINIHASLLPKYRGAAPIQWAVINREKESGVTTMFMDAGMDTGDMLISDTIPLEKGETAQTLHDKLARLGAETLLKTLDGLLKGELKPVPQDHDRATIAPMLKKSDGHIDWKKPALEIEALIRGMTPWPGAFTFQGDKRLKIYKAQAIQENPAERKAAPGTVLPGFPDELRAATGKGVLLLKEIQGASGKRLSIEDFLRGYPIPPETVMR